MAGPLVIVYHGNCHCGSYRFELSVPEIKSAISCSCTLCRKKGSLWLNPPESAFKVVRDDGNTMDYQSVSLRDKFCNICGTQVVGEHLTGPLAGQFLVNVRAIRDPYVNPFQIESTITTVDMEDERLYEPVTQAPGETSAKHTFACHCGKVQAELLTSMQDQEIKEDNCSSCVRVAYIGVYPTKDQVRIHGTDHGFEYRAGRKFGGTVHCKTCGVLVYSNIYGPPISIFDRLPPERKENALKLYHKNMQLKPLNVRAMEGLDLSSLKISRSDEGTEGYELGD